MSEKHIIITEIGATTTPRLADMSKNAARGETSGGAGVISGSSRFSYCCGTPIGRVLRSPATVWMIPFFKFEADLGTVFNGFGDEDDVVVGSGLREHPGAAIMADILTWSSSATAAEAAGRQLGGRDGHAERHDLFRGVGARFLDRRLEQCFAVLTYGQVDAVIGEAGPGRDRVAEQTA